MFRRLSNLARLVRREKEPDFDKLVAEYDPRQLFDTDPTREDLERLITTANVQLNVGGYRLLKPKEFEKFCDIGTPVEIGANHDVLELMKKGVMEVILHLAENKPRFLISRSYLQAVLRQKG